MEDNVQQTNNNLKGKCECCEQTNVELWVCNGCKQVYYCGNECQKSHWPAHKVQCKQIKEKMSQNEKKEELAKEQKKIKSEMDTKSIHRYKFIKKIGVGNFTELYLIEDKITEKQYAMKQIEKKRVKQLQKEKDVIMEKHCLIKMKDSQYIVDFCDTLQDDFHLYLLMEYVDGSELWQYIKVFGLISNAYIKYYMLQIINALTDLHQKGIVHRDLKPENIMVDRFYRIKLIDFGTARDLIDTSVQGSGTVFKGRRNFEHFVGTPQYMAPECIHNKESDYLCDVWSLGCLLFQLVCGFTPFLGGSEYLIFTESLNKEPVFFEGIFCDELKDLITKMLKKDRNERISLNEVKNHPYFQSNSESEKLPDNFEDIQKHVKKYEKILIDIKESLKVKQYDNKDQIQQDIQTLLNKYIDHPEQEEDKEIFSNQLEQFVFTQRLKLLQKQLYHFKEYDEFTFFTLL